MKIIAVLLCCAAMLTSPLSAGENYTLAINHGRVIDPETGLDAVRHIGIVDDTISKISLQPLMADKVIDASGLVVAPGFIDLHTHLLQLFCDAVADEVGAVHLEFGSGLLHGVEE